jgi:isopentenyldiphosphate isomerase
MDELIDILDANGNPTGTSELKSKAHRLGLFHATVHIWMYTNTGEILLQQRGQNKDTYPLLWDVSVAGHIGAGEKEELAAIREIKEEIGLTIQEEALEKIGVYKSMQKHHVTLMDNEFHHTYLCELKVPLSHLKKQESEVANIKLLALVDFERELDSDKLAKRYVPHIHGYYQEIIATIKAKL